MYALLLFYLFFFFNDTATTEIYTLSLHDALPISRIRAAYRLGARSAPNECGGDRFPDERRRRYARIRRAGDRSEEHTSELQSLRHLVCRLLLEKKKKNKKKNKKN